MTKKSAALIAAATVTGAVVVLARSQYRKNKIQSAMDKLTEASCYIETLEKILADFPELSNKVEPFLAFWKIDFPNLGTLKRDAAQVLYDPAHNGMLEVIQSPENLATHLEIAYVRFLTVIGIDIRREYD